MNLQSEAILRLRAADPAPVQPARSRTPAATGALARILADTTSSEVPARRRQGRILGWSSRRLMVVFAVVLVAGGGAFAATDPLGWWSANPTYAKYGSDSTRHVRTPSAQTLACTTSTGLRCVPATWAPGTTNPLVNGHPTTDQPYQFANAVPEPGRELSRRLLLAYVAHWQAAGKLSATHATQFRAAIEAVPDSFFTEYTAASHYSTMGEGGQTRNGLTQVPPTGVPSLIVCEPAGSGLSCQNLNGDEHVPIGAGIYLAEPTKKWHYARVPAENWNLPPGVSFTPAEYRLLIDMLRFATVTGGGSGSGQATTTASPAPTASTPASGSGSTSGGG